MYHYFGLDVEAEISRLAAIGVASNEGKLGVRMLGVGGDFEPSPLDSSLEIGPVGLGGVAIDDDVGGSVGIVGSALQE